MKKIIALILCAAMLFTACGKVNTQPQATVNAETVAVSAEPTAEIAEATPELTAEPTTEPTAETLAAEYLEPQFESLDDEELQCCIGDEIYTELIQTLDPEIFEVQGVETSYISKEYLEEVEYNSQSNIFFGYTLAELDEQFQGKKYVFTLDDDGITTVQELQETDEISPETMAMLKNVAIGTGVILVCATVAIITKNPAIATTAGKTIKIIFAASSSGAKAGTIMALKSAGIGGAMAAITEAVQSGDVKKSLEAGLYAASEGFKLGAIIGTVAGIADGIKTILNSKLFPSGSKQSIKYPEGVEFTKAANGSEYPRFEKWAKATAKFDTPSVETALNHTGLSGNYYWDAKLANAQCGFSKTPAGYVWHHLEDMKTMILVPQDLHSVAMGGMPHKGGASLIRAFLGIS